MSRILLSETVSRAAWRVVVYERELASVLAKKAEIETNLEQAKQSAISASNKEGVASSTLYEYVQEQLNDSDTPPPSERAVAELDDSPAAIQAAMSAYALDFSPDALVQEMDQGEGDLDIDDPISIKRAMDAYGL